MFKEVLKRIPRLNPEGVVFVVSSFLLSVVMFYISTTMAWISLVFSCCCLLFFRDPKRVSPMGEGLVISPADGIVQKITKEEPLEELDLPYKEVYRVSIFLSALDVHVNRVPVSGKVKKLYYHHGKFFNASLDKSSHLNERQSVTIQCDDGSEVGVVQIAGLIARRIICHLSPDQKVKKGDRYGIIKFGSRVDLYLPVEPEVLEGQYMLGGETVIARLK